MANVVKTFNVKNENDIEPQVYEVGAKASNIEVPIDANGSIINDNSSVKTLQALSSILKQVEQKAEYKQMILVSENWNTTSKIYSFEDIYPANKYDIEISLHESCTVEDYQVFNDAKIIGLVSENKIKALGIIPNKNIPIALKVVKKIWQ